MPQTGTHLGARVLGMTLVWCRMVPHLTLQKGSLSPFLSAAGRPRALTTCISKGDWSR